MPQSGGDLAEAERIINSWINEGDTDRYLDLGTLNLRTLPRLPINVKRLSCAFNKLTHLPNLPESLEELVCFDNRLRSLPKLPNTLTTLICFSNNLTILPKLPESLQVLLLFDNPLPESYSRLAEDEAEEDPIHLHYIERIRRLQQKKENIMRNLNTHKTAAQRSKFAKNFGNNKNNPLHRYVIKNIANYLNRDTLQNLEVNSLNPSNVEFLANRSAARKRYATRKKKYRG